MHANETPEQEATPLTGVYTHSDRMASLGVLTAGIAHEINTPIQFIGDNLQFVRESLEELNAVFTTLDSLLDAARGLEVLSHEVTASLEAASNSDLKYLREELPQAISQSISGVRQIAGIVSAMKTFSHPGESVPAMADINQVLELTAAISRNEWKYVARLELDLAEGLPQVPCFASELSQVWLNLIVNGAHAIKQKDHDELGLIRITSHYEEDAIMINVFDTGAGIPSENRQRVFDPFFSTKPTGEGTGQGLAIAKRIIEERHHGTLTLNESAGDGTCFLIRLPLLASNQEG